MSMKAVALVVALCCVVLLAEAAEVSSLKKHHRVRRIKARAKSDPEGNACYYHCTSEPTKDAEGVLVRIPVAVPPNKKVCMDATENRKEPHGARLSALNKCKTSSIAPKYKEKHCARVELCKLISVYEEFTAKVGPFDRSHVLGVKPAEAPVPRSADPPSSVPTAITPAVPSPIPAAPIPATIPTTTTPAAAVAPAEDPEAVKAIPEAELSDWLAVWRELTALSKSDSALYVRRAWVLLSFAHAYEVKTLSDEMACERSVEADKLKCIADSRAFKRSRFTEQVALSFFNLHYANKEYSNGGKLCKNGALTEDGQVFFNAKGRSFQILKEGTQAFHHAVLIQTSANPNKFQFLQSWASKFDPQISPELSDAELCGCLFRSTAETAQKCYNVPETEFSKKSAQVEVMNFGKKKTPAWMLSPSEAEAQQALSAIPTAAAARKCVLVEPVETMSDCLTKSGWQKKGM